MAITLRAFQAEYYLLRSDWLKLTWMIASAEPSMERTEDNTNNNKLTLCRC